jgi:hypothetical protein
MPSVIQRIPALILLAFTVLFAIPRASASEAPTEIRLGKPAPPAPKADPAAVRAVERFFAARQSASMDRSRLAAAQHGLAGAVKVEPSTLAGEPGQTLVAFDFQDGAIERLGSGRFRVSVYLLFADRQGKVAESRDEVLTFTGQAASYACASLRTTNVMRWDTAEVVRSAERLHSSQALETADQFLKAWTHQQNRLAAYSIEDVYPAGTGRIMLPCLKFTAAVGKRGYDVVDSPIMMRRGARGFQIESAAN